MPAAPDPGTPEELVPISIGAERLGVAHDTLRKSLSTGKYRGEKREGRWWVWLPVEHPAQASQEPGTIPAEPGKDPASLAEIIRRLERENDYLRQTLDAEIEARRRSDHLVAGMMEKLPALAATTGTMPDAPQASQDRPGRAETPTQAVVDYQKGSAAPEPSGLRGWLLRLLRGGE